MEIEIFSDRIIILPTQIKPNMKLRNSLIVLTCIAGSFFLSECDDKSTTPVVTPPKDTTAVKPINKFRAGFEVYNLDINTDLSYGTYYVADNETVIQIAGVSSKNSIQGAVDGPGDMIITFPGNKVGSFKQDSGDPVELEIGTGEGIKRNEYGTDTDSKVEINVTTYDAVGGRIKGTFTAKLKSGINSITVDQGVFDVQRKPNQ